jgi:prophage regulatory protein
MNRILEFSEIAEITKLSRMTITRMEKKNAFPKRVSISPNRVGWKESEVKAWLENGCKWPLTNTAHSPRKNKKA